MKVKGIISTIFFGLMAMIAFTSIFFFVFLIVNWIVCGDNGILDVGTGAAISLSVFVVSVLICRFGEKHCNKDDDDKIFKDGGGSKFDL